MRGASINSALLVLSQELTGTKGVQSTGQVVVFLDDRRALLLPVGCIGKYSANIKVEGRPSGYENAQQYTAR